MFCPHSKTNSNRATTRGKGNLILVNRNKIKIVCRCRLVKQTYHLQETEGSQNSNLESTIGEGQVNTQASNSHGASYALNGNQRK